MYDKKQGQKSYRYNAIAWIRMRKNAKGEYFYVVSFEDGKRAILRMDNQKIAEVRQDDKLLGAKVVGSIVVDTQDTGKQTYQKRDAAPAARKPVSDNDMDF